MKNDNEKQEFYENFMEVLLKRSSCFRNEEVNELVEKIATDEDERWKCCCAFHSFSEFHFEDANVISFLFKKLDEFLQKEHLLICIKCKKEYKPEGQKAPMCMDCLTIKMSGV